MESGYSDGTKKRLQGLTQANRRSCPKAFRTAVKKEGVRMILQTSTTLLSRQLKVMGTVAGKEDKKKNGRTRIDPFLPSTGW